MQNATVQIFAARPIETFRPIGVLHESGAVHLWGLPGGFDEVVSVLRIQSSNPEKRNALLLYWCAGRMGVCAEGDPVRGEGSPPRSPQYVARTDLHLHPLGARLARKVGVKS